MSRKYYKVFIDLVVKLLQTLENDNPRFDRNKFLGEVFIRARQEEIKKELK